MTLKVLSDYKMVQDIGHLQPFVLQCTKCIWDRIAAIKLARKDDLSKSLTSKSNQWLHSEKSKMMQRNANTWIFQLLCWDLITRRFIFHFEKQLRRLGTMLKEKHSTQWMVIALRATKSAKYTHWWNMVTTIHRMAGGTDWKWFKYHPRVNNSWFKSRFDLSIKIRRNCWGIGFIVLSFVTSQFLPPP